MITKALRMAWRLKLTGQEWKIAAVSDAAAFTRVIAAINNDAGGGEYTITLTGSFNSNPVAFTGGAAKTVTLKGDGSVRAVSNNGGGSLFTVPEGITLVLENNLTLNGNGKPSPLVYVTGGALTMKAGVTLRGAADYGVSVHSGSFTMSGGTLSGNGNTAILGGGVNVYGGSFTMSGGTISGNTARFAGGGVSVSGGSFTMSGGTISGNIASGNGGGVYVDGTFIKSGGGTIDNTNSAARGGFVVWVFKSDGAWKHDTAAGPGVNLDSRVSGRAGGWE